MSDSLIIRGAKTHNLKNISLSIPKGKLVVFTGVSGSGKSSLAFDTIYAEWQRQYLESLSTYARMIVSSINDDTKVDEIRGLSPTISIHQKTVSSNPRSTVGTITEIYDYLRLLFATIGVPHCPNHPKEILKKDTVANVVEKILKLDVWTKFHILSPISYSKGLSYQAVSNIVLEKGFVRYQIGEEVLSVGDEVRDEKVPHQPYIIIDRLVVKDGEERENFLKRIREDVELAYKNGDDMCELFILDTNERFSFRAKDSCGKCDFKIDELSLSHFSFNSHNGACEVCHGLGTEIAFLEENIINPRLSLAEWAILPWTSHPYYTVLVEAVCKKYKIPLDTPYKGLTRAQREIILHGVGDVFEVPYMSKYGSEKSHHAKYEGLVPNLIRRYREADSEDPYARRISQFVTEISCPECNGYRLKKAYLSVLIKDKNIGELASLSVKELSQFFQDLRLTPNEEKIAKDIRKNISERLEFLKEVGLEYVTLERRANTLSGGESQRIRLATQIGTRLEGIIYVLDEPSIGLHPRDNTMLIGAIKRLAEIGNTVLVVEHDEDIMEASDYIVDIGPGAGKHGGEIVFMGTPDEIMVSESETGLYLSGRKRVEIEKKNRTPPGYIEIFGATENNLKDIDVKIPLGALTTVTGVSGSGKSSLIMDTLANRALRHFGIETLGECGRCREIHGLEHLDKAVIIDQSPIGRTPHSNVATYTGVFSIMREVFASSVEAKKRGYGPGRFSFNTKWGRCEVCEWSGVKKIEMHFLPDVYVECESCHGSRYNPETLEVKFKGKTIAEVLAMTCEEALNFFTAFPRISRILGVLVDVGLGYISLGQWAPTLSGWEAQRVKLAFDLAKRSTSKTLYILDEPTTGLHFSDTQKLLDILDRLVDRGNTVLVIEHNLDIIANSDYLIDIGPVGGHGGWQLLFSGKTEDILKVKSSHTAEALGRYLDRKNRQKKLTK